MKTLVCFGDSLTARYEGKDNPRLTEELSSQLPTYNVVNAGVSGHTTKDALRRIEKDVLTIHPDLVTVLFGSNDVASHKKVTLKTYKENILEITHLIGPEKTILISPPPVDEAMQPNRKNKELARYADAVRDVAKETGSHYIDFFTDLYSRPNYEELLVGILNDGLHFGGSGYDILSTLILSKIQEIDSKGARQHD
ncbi:SGNH/GDSL hydrolase family protein [Sutcliffiella horikoshii]|uniref:SGNH/GDSL hydrolase family protein n=1 Tax=Sutcliffiella horikoshii TaxID=79883 RepID=UPI0007D07B05|nr:SGNH/GDSL hydrolase family protein [Sutcliffiella horikoshii]MCM3616112.1 SGNH/GDSL hydrolase family protein [Sutcliffiella horikoshii]